MSMPSFVPESALFPRRCGAEKGRPSLFGPAFAEPGVWSTCRTVGGTVERESAEFRAPGMPLHFRALSLPSAGGQCGTGLFVTAC